MDADKLHFLKVPSGVVTGPLSSAVLPGACKMGAHVLLCARRVSPTGSEVSPDTLPLEGAERLGTHDIRRRADREIFELGGLAVFSVPPHLGLGIREGRRPTTRVLVEASDDEGPGGTGPQEQNSLDPRSLGSEIPPGVWVGFGYRLP